MTGAVDLKVARATGATTVAEAAAAIPGATDVAVQVAAGAMTPPPNPGATADAVQVAIGAINNAVREITWATLVAVKMAGGAARVLPAPDWIAGPTPVAVKIPAGLTIKAVQLTDGATAVRVQIAGTAPRVRPSPGATDVAVKVATDATNEAEIWNCGATALYDASAARGATEPPSEMTIGFFLSNRQVDIADSIDEVIVVTQ